MPPSAAKSYIYDKKEGPELVDIPRILTEEFLREFGAERLGSKTRLFFDYDEDEKKNPECANQEYCNKKSKEIRNRLEANCTNWTRPFIMTESKQPNKVSFHVVFISHKDVINRSEFKKEFEKELFVKIVGEENFQYIDENVYGNKHWFRLPYGTDKIAKKPYPHIPFTQHGQPKPDLYNFVLTCPDEADTIDYSKNPSYINYQYKKYMSQLEKENKIENIVVDEEYQSKIIVAIKKLNPERFKDYNNWLILVFLMKHFLPEEVDLFCTLSKQSGYIKYDERNCRTTFQQANPEAFTHCGILYKWLSEDGINPTTIFPKYSPMLKKLIKIHRSSIGGFTDYNIGNAIKEIYHEELFYCNQYKWVHWNSTYKMWRSGDDSIIFKPLMDLLTNEYFDWVKRMEKENAPLPNESKEDFEKRGCIPRMTISGWYQDGASLQSVKRIKQLLEYCKSIFLDEELVQKFNTKPELFAFKNSIVYNLKTCESRPIEKTDYILNHCGYDFPEKKQEDIIKVKDLLETIFDKSQVEYALSCLSLSLYGNNLNEAFIIWKGRGRNGKGLLSYLLSVVMGAYFQTLSTEELTEESKGKGRANSEIANARFTRCLMSSEPAENTTMKADIIKKLTGRDPINARQLYGEAFIYIPQFTLYIQCNDVPKFSKLSDAIEKRVRYLDFNFQFVPEADIIRDYQRPIKEHLKEEVKYDVSYRNGLLFLLFETWFKTQGKLLMTEEAKESHKEEMDANNPLSEFLRTKEPSVEFVYTKDLYKIYTDANLYESMSSKKFNEYIRMCKTFRVVEDKSNGLKIYCTK